MIFEENMVVILTKGRHASMKAVVMKVIDQDYIVVGGVAKVPTEVKEYMAEWQKRRAAKFITFVKKINVKHVIATRYTADLNMKAEIENVDISEQTAKAGVNKNLNKALKKIMENETCRFLFTELEIKA